LTWLVGQWENARPVLLVLAIGAVFSASVTASLLYPRYIAILTRCGPHARPAYDALRRSLVEGGLAATTYARWLRAALGSVDWFLGDADKAG
jgi:hypothetical protein